MKQTWYARGGKRVLDVAVASAALVASWPVMAAVALAVRSRLGSPVLFRQQRPGLHGRPFTISKFRTMTDARDQHGQLLGDGARLTPLGRMLRRTSLDELPELVDVLRGDMSLVGPRPLLERYRPSFTPRERTRELVRPGITGLAQVRGRNHATWDDRLEFDAAYVDGLSLRGDLRILAETVWAVVSARGVEADASAVMLDLDVERGPRTLGPEHAESIVSLQRRAFDADELHTTIFAGHGVDRYYADVLGGDADHRVLGTFERRRLVGYAHLRDLGEVSHLNQIATCPCARGRGVGRRLFEAWLAHAGDRDLSLDVREGSPAEAWYRRLGFAARRRTVLWRIPASDGPGLRLEATKASADRHRRYGFSMAQARVGDRTLEVGRLGHHDLRVPSPLPEPVFDDLRRGRRLLVLGDERAPHPEASALHAVLRMAREVA